MWHWISSCTWCCCCHQCINMWMRSYCKTLYTRPLTCFGLKLLEIIAADRLRPHGPFRGERFAEFNGKIQYTSYSCSYLPQKTSVIYFSHKAPVNTHRSRGEKQLYFRSAPKSLTAVMRRHAARLTPTPKIVRWARCLTAEWFLLCNINNLRLNNAGRAPARLNWKTLSNLGKWYQYGWAAAGTLCYFISLEKQKKNSAGCLSSLRAG